MSADKLLLVYLLPLLLIWAAWIGIGKLRSRRDRAILEDNIQAGLMEPNTLHPVIDPALCLGCAACARACPEKTIIGIIDGKAALIEPSMCVGHGACAQACPTKAITLVFGSETRGVDIPILSPSFETSVPGIFIAGELGGMGLIKNAIEQGRQAIVHAATRSRSISGEPDVLDVVIVGCGPAGIAASLGAIEQKLKFVTLDQSSLGGTVSHFPRGKLVMTAPATLPLVGKVKFGEVSKEKLLAFWQGVLKDTGLKPNFEEHVAAVHRHGELFEVVTSRRSYRTRTVLLAIGRRGSPRTLDVPGEELDKVVYRLIDPEQYAGKKVLVVGGGDSALEAAVRIADQPGTQVTISYRSAAYSRARSRNREAIQQAVEQGRVTQLLGSHVEQIDQQSVILRHGGQSRRIDNDYVIICAGGILPTQFLHDMGVTVETKFGKV
ncbi:NAD(P)-binding domain-containing protein [Novosphingobium sp.]|uniref:NAD(P)-binding domain-containing protein n=1 Tax=Novosphingobium sp. TaxID=1874826 RepID=UPI00286E4910|nr:NAD(P)-binding domain-containing protein [Novosphingobium sp.]